jgi:hypothetical protein
MRVAFLGSQESKEVFSGLTPAEQKQRQPKSEIQSIDLCFIGLWPTKSPAHILHKRRPTTSRLSAGSIECILI